jgi:aerobic-type carbon monoxide dehydrogenase small subunit (CoxS/CutS family)
VLVRAQRSGFEDREAGFGPIDAPIVRSTGQSALEDVIEGRVSLESFGAPYAAPRATPAGRRRMTERIELTVNGRDEVLRVEDGDTLVEALRRELSLFGVREACGIGVCGACTVLMDGRPVSGCLVLARFAEGVTVLTVEALAPDGALDPIQQAFVDHNAFQCSYCTPGFLMATRALLAEEPHPTPERVRHALAGNLCRCGSYLKIEAAVLDAADRLAAGPSV